MIVLILLIIWVSCVLFNITISLKYGNKEIVRGAVLGLLLGPLGIPAFIWVANFDKRLNSPVDINKQCISCGKEGHFDRYRYYAGILHRTSESVDYVSIYTSIKTKTYFYTDIIELFASVCSNCVKKKRRYDLIETSVGSLLLSTIFGTAGALCVAYVKEGVNWLSLGMILFSILILVFYFNYLKNYRNRKDDEYGSELAKNWSEARGSLKSHGKTVAWTEREFQFLRKQTTRNG